MVLSQLPDASIFPSGLKAMLLPARLCVDFRMSKPVDTSQNSMTALLYVEARVFPSGLKATEETNSDGEMVEESWKQYCKLSSIDFG